MFIWLGRFYPIEDEKKRNDVINAISGSPTLVDSIGRYFYEMTQKLILHHSFTLVGNKTFGIDLIQYVVRELPIHWAATDLVCKGFYLQRFACVVILWFHGIGWHSAQDKGEPWGCLYSSRAVRYLE
jgi:hypothetical protein